MQLIDILSLNATRKNIECNSKKRILEYISEIIASEANLNIDQIFESLLIRERMGNTGIGHGVAIPHGRLNNIKKPFTVLIQTKTPIEYDSNDGQLVDLFFGVILPNNENPNHMNIIDKLIEKLKNSFFCKELRKTKFDYDLYHMAIIKEIEQLK